MPPNSPPTLTAPRPGKGVERGARECRTAEALLGLGHPLVGLLYACQTTVEEIGVVAALQTGGVLLLLASAPFALPLTVAAAALQLGLGVRLAILSAYRNDACRDLVIDGEERLPLAALRLELRRLRDPRRRAWLARSLEELAKAVAQPRREIGFGRPLCSRHVLAAVEPQLRDLARLLRTDGVGVRGIALLDRLVTSGTSPLYGGRVGPLRDELGRIRYFLGCDQPSVAGA